MLQSAIKVFQRQAFTADQLEVVMKAELRKMLQAEIQVKEGNSGANILEAISWMSKFPLKSGRRVPAIEMVYGGRYGALCMR